MVRSFFMYQLFVASQVVDEEQRNITNNDEDAAKLCLF